MILGLETVATFPDLFEALANKGWTDDELGKLAALFEEVAAIANNFVGRD